MTLTDEQLDQWEDESWDTAPPLVRYHDLIAEVRRLRKIETAAEAMRDLAVGVAANLNSVEGWDTPKDAELTAQIIDSLNLIGQAFDACGLRAALQEAEKP